MITADEIPHQDGRHKTPEGGNSEWQFRKFVVVRPQKETERTLELLLVGDET